MKTTLLACLLLLLVVFSPSTDASGRGRIARAEANAYARTLRLNYPGPWGLRWRNYADTHVFSNDGFLDRALERLLNEVAAGETASSMLTAQTAPVPNAVLDQSLDRSRSILKTLEIDDPNGTPQTTTQPGTGTKNSRLDDVVP